MKAFQYGFRVLAIAALVVTMFGSVAYADILRGPYLQRVDTESTTVLWETYTDEACTLEYGADESFGYTQEAGTEIMHVSIIEGLQPATSYSYRIVCGEYTSKTYTFKTAPVIGTPFRFVVYGDTRSGYDAHMKVVDIIEDADPDVYLNTGDIVGSDEDVDGWQKHFEIEANLMATRQLMVAVGNHETNNGKAPTYEKYYVEQLTEETERGPEGRYYYVDYSNVRIVVLDSEMSSLFPGGSQVDWLLDVLDDAEQDVNIRHVFLSLHQGPFSAKPSRSGYIAIRMLLDSLEDYNITAVLSGHDHHYWRGTSSAGLPFIVTGGGGAGLYECEPDGAFEVVTVESFKDYHAVIMDVEGDIITVTTKDDKGEVRDSFTFTSTMPGEPEYPVDPVPSDSDGGCSGTSAAGAMLATMLLLALRRRREH